MTITEKTLTAWLTEKSLHIMIFLSVVFMAFGFLAAIRSEVDGVGETAFLTNIESMIKTSQVSPATSPQDRVASAMLSYAYRVTDGFGPAPGVVAARMTNLFFALAAIWLVYLTVKLIAPDKPKAWLIGALILTTSPSLIAGSVKLTSQPVILVVFSFFIYKLIETLDNGELTTWAWVLVSLVVLYLCLPGTAGQFGGWLIVITGALRAFLRYKDTLDAWLRPRFKVGAGALVVAAGLLAVGAARVPQAAKTIAWAGAAVTEPLSYTYAWSKLFRRVAWASWAMPGIAQEKSALRFVLQQASTMLGMMGLLGLAIIIYQAISERIRLVEDREAAGSGPLKNVRFLKAAADSWGNNRRLAMLVILALSVILTIGSLGISRNPAGLSDEYITFLTLPLMAIFTLSFTRLTASKTLPMVGLVPPGVLVGLQLLVLTRFI